MTQRTIPGKPGPSGQWVRMARLQLGITQHDLGEALGHRCVWVCNVEAGRVQAGPGDELAIRHLLTLKKERGAQ